MKKNMDFDEARALMLGVTRTIDTETIPITEAYGRVLAEDICAQCDNPPFDRSAFDGYAFRAEDVQMASPEAPVTLRIIEEIPAGTQPKKALSPGTAAKILTGAPIPQGADAVVKFEITEFTRETVTLFAPAGARNIVTAGEDVFQGSLLAERGAHIDPPMLATIAAQGIGFVPVYQRPRVGILATGSEVVEINQPVGGGKIRNSNRYVLEGICRSAGVEPMNLGIAKDTVADISARLLQGLETCDVIITTGGVSVGDFDVTPEAVEAAGVEILVRGLALKPGGACAYGVKDGKLVFCLSGNPASGITNFYAVAHPCLKKCAGRTDLGGKTFVKLAQPFGKASPHTRLLRGRQDLSSGEHVMHVSGQGNAMLHAMIGCDVMAIIPAGSPALSAGTVLEAFFMH